ncbi:zinc finger CCCH domain-containing protein 10-like [Neocloeon triangulifer]|uniref:zinc finger CCCH domain-containing protein 10-like n=1 Tax=Neocloeon triangulifer TaxID=2078957 RepID=UPI00286F04E7|nr:zinc finger CCCH domain-containing protein 10-like [Neocloeon triangulifer]
MSSSCGGPDRTDELSMNSSHFNTVCRDFLRNTCRRGKRCKFQHTIPCEETNNNNNSQVLFCHDFQNKGCPRANCRFVHCSRDEEEAFKETGRLPLNATVSAHIQGLMPLDMLQGEPPVCTEYLRGNCRRNRDCKYRHLTAAQVMQLSLERLEPPVKRQRYSEEVEARISNLQDENLDLKRMLDELHRQVETLAATNEVLLEQNARLRLKPQTAAVVSLPAVTITNTTDGPPVTIATAVGPGSVTQVSLATAGISIAPPVVTVAQAISANGTTPASQTIPITISSTTSSLVPYPIVTHVHRPGGAVHHSTETCISYGEKVMPCSAPCNL